jgi:hypothetical protein
MARVIPEQYLDLFEDRTFANLATLMPDGSPQVTPVFITRSNRYTPHSWDDRLAG